MHSCFSFFHLIHFFDPFSLHSERLLCYFLFPVFLDIRVKKAYLWSYIMHSSTSVNLQFFASLIRGLITLKALAKTSSMYQLSCSYMISELVIIIFNAYKCQPNNVITKCCLNIHITSDNLSNDVKLTSNHNVLCL